MIIISKASIWDDDIQPVPGAVKREEQFEGFKFPTIYWTIDLTIEEVVKKYGKCIVNYRDSLKLFSVTVYDDYVE